MSSSEEIEPLGWDLGAKKRSKRSKRDEAGEDLEAIESDKGSKEDSVKVVSHETPSEDEEKSFVRATASKRRTTHRGRQLVADPFFPTLPTRQFPSRVKEPLLLRFRLYYEIPFLYKIREPIDGEQAYDAATTKMCLYEQTFKSSLKFPINPITVEILKYYHIALAQLALNGSSYLHYQFRHSGTPAIRRSISLPVTRYILFDA
ncbi:hypothetical protein NE237_012663 [Protea cynaroides]|uniref:Uncharacterized protein n=1 Tax=Protea cynaroides TaxID=273540 RepID=A0A9Q0JZ19_9MAGN|nr:hypothetical protein NE237_012663 [Protea cynaroides]